MFSQFRNAVEHLAQQPTSTTPAQRPASKSVSSQSGPQPIGETQRSPTDAFDESRKSLSLTTPSQLAESALLNFRKTLTSSRTSSPGPFQMADRDRQIKSLEERLRASFALGDASERTTPETSKLPSPSEIDPTTIALPRSPEQELPVPSLEGAFDPLGAQISPSVSRNAFSPSPHTETTQSFAEQLPIGVDYEPIQENTSPRVELPLSSPRPQSPSIVPPTVEPPPAEPHADVLIRDPRMSTTPGLDSRPLTPRPLSPLPIDDNETDIEKLRERLKLVEQRFADVSTSFKRLQAEKRAADRVLKELTPVESISDVGGLQDHLKNVAMKSEMSSEEIKRLNVRVQQHDARLEELRDTHRLESASQSEQVERLQKQLSETEALLKVGKEESTKERVETQQLQADLDRARGVAKEEEEKRTKAISLLKTVRAKLVKAEKEREDAVREAAGIRENEKEEREKEQLDRSRLELDLDRAKLEREREVTGLRAQFERELAALKDRFEKESTARKGQAELEAITTKAAHTKEVAAKTSRITVLESTVRTLAQEKDTLFDQLQMRQAELESSQSHLDSVEARSTEYQYQLREAENRVDILTEELAEMNRKAVNGGSSGGSFSSADEVARILSEAEGKYEARIGDLRSKLRTLERERHDAEEEWSRNLQERGRELERLRGLVEGKDREYAESVRGKTETEVKLLELEADNQKLRAQTEAEQGIILGLQRDMDWLKEAETAIKQDRDELRARLEIIERQVEETIGHEAALKASNKTLREELRKVQASAALLERQRNPGIGYWSTSTRPNGFTQSAIDLQHPGQPSRTSVDDGSRASSPRPSSPTSVTSKNEDEVNLEYLRNVILQFLEHKEMRPNLVRVLSIILHFTPQETRRLIAKV